MDSNRQELKVENSEGQLQEYVFVNLVDSQGLGKTARAVVRSQVTRDYHRRAKNQVLPVLSRIASLEEAVVQPNKQMNRFRLRPEGLQETTKRPKPKQHRHAHTPALSASTLASAQPPDDEVEVDITSSTSEQTEPKIAKLNEPVRKKQIALAHCDDNRLKKVTLYIARQKTLQKKPNPGLGAIGSPMDPFDVVPWSMSTRTWAFIYDFFTARENVSALMLSIRKEWFALAIHDQAMFLGALSHYAGSYSLHRAKGDPAESLAYRTRAIQIINGRLEHSRSHFSNGTIGAATNGSQESARIHISGLHYMINARGGVLHAAFPLALQSLVIWADMTSANALGSDPRIMPFGTLAADIPSRGWDFCSLSQALPLSSLVTSPNVFLLKDEIAAMLSELRLLSDVLNLRHVRSVKGSGETSYSDRIYLVQRGLTYLSNYSQSGSADTYTSLCTAALIYVVSVLRDVGFHPQIIATLVSKLKTCLGQSWHALPPVEIDIEVAKRTLWTLVIGGSAAIGKPERVWYVVHLAALCEQLDLYCWAEVEIILAGVVWKSDWERPNGKLWEEVQATRLRKARLKQESQAAAVETIGLDWAGAKSDLLSG
ncbi:hypothetical protein MMC11_003504 [Xylographa trunciseda]|nr:hypothetical protein [Xylographa trunciseda]